MTRVFLWTMVIVFSSFQAGDAEPGSPRWLIAVIFLLVGVAALMDAAMREEQ